MADETAYSIGSMNEVPALADTDMMELERPNGDPPTIPNSWWKITGLKLATYVLSKIVNGSGIRLSSAGGQLTIEGIGATVGDITSTSYTLTSTDFNRMRRCNSATAQTITIPAQSAVAAPDGTQVEFVQWGAGAVTIVAGSGVTLRRNANLGAASDGQYSVIGIKRMAADEWVVFGQLGAP